MATISPNLPQPIDYSIDVKMPFEASLEGFKLGSDVATIQAAQQKRLLDQQAAQQAQARQAELGTRLKSFYNKKPEERNFEEIEQLFAFAGNKEQLDALKLMAEGTDKRRLDTDKRFYAQVMLGLESEPTVAFKLLDDRILAEKDPGQKAALETIKRTAETVNPAAAVNLIEPYTASIFGKDWYAGLKDARAERRLQELAPSALQKSIADADEAVAKAETAQATAKNADEKAAADAAKATADAQQAAVKAKYEERERLAALEKSNWDVKNLKSQISDRSQQLNLRSQEVAATVAEKLASAGAKLNEVPADTKKLINESAVAAATSKQSAGQFNDLAKRLEAEGGGYGIFSSASDYLKKGVGFQGGMTQLRQEYIRLRNTAAIKSLPPGPATDRDIALALRGFPADNASASDLASFLRGMAKLQDIDASINNAKTDWLTNNNGSLARAKNTFIAGDYAAKSGENFNDFSTRIIDDVTKKYDPRSQSSVVDQIPTDKNPRPMATQNNVRSAADAILRGGQ
jgi:hypothetical protein